MTNMQQEQDEDIEFLQLAEVDDLNVMGGQDVLNQALGGSNGEHWEEISFNVIEYCSQMQDHSIGYLFYKICKHNNFYSEFNFSMETAFNLCMAINKGYPDENPYHNQKHIVDSL